MPGDMRFVQNPSAKVTIEAEGEHAPLRYWWCSNRSSVGTSVNVYASQTAGGELIAVVPPGGMIGLPCRDHQAITFAIAANAAAASATDECKVGATTAHLPPAAAALVDPSTGYTPVELKGSTQSDGSSLWLPGLEFNGSTYDRPYNNTIPVNAIASAARTASVNSALITNPDGHGIMLWFGLTATAGTAKFAVCIYAYDPVIGAYVAINNPTASNGWTVQTSGGTAATVGNYGLMMYPSALSSPFQGSLGTVGDSHMVPRQFYVGVVPSDGSSNTYSVDYSLLK